MKVFSTDIPRRELVCRVGNFAHVRRVLLLAQEKDYARSARLIDDNFPVKMGRDEERTYQLEFGLLASGEAINAFAASLPSVDTRDA